MKIINKVFIGLLLATAILLPAAGVKALSYGRGMMGTTISANNNDVVYQAQLADVQKIQDYMVKLQNGNLNADEQKEMYSVMNSPAPMMGFAPTTSVFGGRQNGYGMMSGFYGTTMPGYSHQFMWYSLMCVITIILLWAVLLLSIVALYKWIKLKNHIK